MRIQVRRTRRQANWLDSASLQSAPEHFRKLRIAIHQKVSLPTEEPFFGVHHIPGNLEKPAFIWIGGETRKMNPPGCNLHKKEQIVSDQSVLRPNPDGREIHGSKHVPMCLEETSPAGLSPSIRCRIYSMFLQNVRNCRIRDYLPEILERTLDTGIAPTRVFLCQFQNKIYGLMG